MLEILGLSGNSYVVFVFPRFAFFKVLPGDYEILAAHPTWALKEVSVSIWPSAAPAVCWCGDRCRAFSSDMKSVDGFSGSR